jgi:hypothetical protein
VLVSTFSSVCFSAVHFNDFTLLLVKMGIGFYHFSSAGVVPLISLSSAVFELVSTDLDSFSSGR